MRRTFSCRMCQIAHLKYTAMDLDMAVKRGCLTSVSIEPKTDA